MRRTVIRHDMISESEFTIGMTARSTRPENDSPGDSDSDSNYEHYMGLAFTHDPDEFDCPITRSSRISKYPHRAIPESAKVVNSDAPSHKMDQSTDSDTH